MNILKALFGTRKNKTTETTRIFNKAEFMPQQSHNHSLTDYADEEETRRKRRTVENNNYDNSLLTNAVLFGMLSTPIDNTADKQLQANDFGGGDFGGAGATNDYGEKASDNNNSNSNDNSYDGGSNSNSDSGSSYDSGSSSSYDSGGSSDSGGGDGGGGGGE